MLSFGLGFDSIYNQTNILQYVNALQCTIILYILPWGLEHSQLEDSIGGGPQRKVTYKDSTKVAMNRWVSFIIFCFLAKLSPAQSKLRNQTWLTLSIPDQHNSQNFNPNHPYLAIPSHKTPNSTPVDSTRPNHHNPIQPNSIPLNTTSTQPNPALPNCTKPHETQPIRI